MAGKRKAKPKGSALMALPPKRGRTPIPNQPATKPWKVICARTRAAMAERDAYIAGVVLPPGPAMIRGRVRQRLSDEEITAACDEAVAIEAAARPPKVKPRRWR